MKARRQTTLPLVAAGIAATLLATYLHFGLFPGNLKRYALENIETLTGRKVRFEKTVYIPFRGLTFHGLEVMDFTGRPLFAAEKLTIDAEILPFLRENRVIVRRVHLDSPVFDWSLEPAPKPGTKPALPPRTRMTGQIEVPVAPEGRRVGIESISDGPNALVPENVYLREIRIVNGLVRVRPKPGAAPIEEIRSANLRVRFRRPPLLEFDGSLQLGADSYANATLRGLWNLDRADYQFLFAVQSRRVPEWLAAYQKKNFARLHAGSFDLKARVQSSGDRKALFRCESDLRDADIGAGGARYTGRMALEATGAFDFGERRFTAYQGSLDFVDVNVDDLSETIKELRNISGRILFRPNLLEIRAMRGQYSEVVFEAGGEIRSFKDLILKAEVRAHSTLAQLLSLLSMKDREGLKGFEVGGRCEAVTTIEGSLRQPKALKKRHKIEWSEGSIRNEAKKLEIAGISADLVLDEDATRVTESTFTMGGKQMELSGAWPKTTTGAGDVKLATPEYRLSASFDRAGEALTIRDGRLKTTGVTASFKGRASGLLDPVVDLAGNIEIDLPRVLAKAAAGNKTLADADLKGVLSGRFAMKGPAQKPLLWDFKIDGKGKGVYARGARLDGFEMQVRLKNRLVNVPYFHAKPYGGSLGGRLFLDLSKKETFFNLKLYGRELDLAALGKDLRVPSKELAGSAIFQINMRGYAQQQESWAGDGMLDVRDGHLWKTDLFKKMGELPFVRVIGLDEVVFRNARATYEVRQKRVHTKDLRLTSDTVELGFDGSCGFDQTLDAIMSIRYSSGVLEGAIETGGIVPFVLGQAEGMISQYKISGTLAKPKNDKLLFAPAKNVAKKLAGAVQAVTP